MMISKKGEDSNNLRSYLKDANFVKAYLKYIKTITGEIEQIYKDLNIPEYRVISAGNLIEVRNNKPDLRYSRFIKETGAEYRNPHNKKVWAKIIDQNQIAFTDSLDFKHKKTDVPFTYIGVPTQIHTSSDFEEIEYFEDILRIGKHIAFAEINLQLNPKIQEVLFRTIFEKLNPQDDVEKYDSVQKAYKIVKKELVNKYLRSLSNGMSENFWDAEVLSGQINQIINPEPKKFSIEGMVITALSLRLISSKTEEEKEVAINMYDDRQMNDVLERTLQGKSRSRAS